MEQSAGNSSTGQPHLNLRAAASCRWDVLALGEVMLRFDPGEDRIAHARSFRVCEGGGEYNVARGLRRCFGLRSSIVTALVDNPVGRLVEDLMLQGGVDLSHLVWRPFDGVGSKVRNGSYFLERGFGLRGAVGVMDRGHTAISQMLPHEVDWDAIFGGEGVCWFHTGGVMAALSESSTAVVRAAMEAAHRHGVIVSYDCNYRPSLWKERGGRMGSIDVNRSLMPLVDILFGHEGDLASTLTETAGGPVWHSAETYPSMIERLLRDFPNIQVVASTMRRTRSANRNDWGAFGYADGQTYEGRMFQDLEVLDRVGGGDSFASGLIYGLMTGRGMQWSLNCGVAHGALAMTTPGDSSMATLAEVEWLMAGGRAGVQR